MKKFCSLFLLLVTFFCNAQNPGDVAQNYGTFLGLNSYINSMILQPDGKIIIAGLFSTFNGVSEKHIIRLNADGTKDTTFNITGSGFNSTINRIALQSDGKIIAFGFFTTYNNEVVNGIIRLNADGTRDTSFNTGTGFNQLFSAFNTLGSIAVQSDGKILLGGNFTTFNDLTTNKIIRLNSDGTKDTSFNTGSGFPNTDINSIVLQSDGKILVAINKIIRLNTNGSTDTSFSLENSFNGPVLSIALQGDGKIVAGGNFTTINGIIRNRIIRLNSNGSIDNSFNAGNGFNLKVYSIYLTTDNKIIVGGDFTSYKNIIENRIIRLNTNGTKDTSFNSGTGFNNNVSSIVMQSDGKIILGGSFSSFNGFVESKFIRLNATGTKDTSFALLIPTGFNSAIFDIVIQSDGKAIIVGDFTAYNGAIENRIIRLNADGTKDLTFNTGTGFNTQAQSVVLQSDGKILVGGVFNSYNGINTPKIVRLNSDGTKDTSFTFNTEFNHYVRAIALQNDGKILIGGIFIGGNNGILEESMMRLNANGTIDTSFNTETGFEINLISTIAVQTDGKILVGFPYTGFPNEIIVRLNANGTKDTSFIVSSGFIEYNEVTSIVLQSDGKILVGGLFNAYNGVTENNIIRLNADGTKDTTFNSGTGFNESVRSISLVSDGKIIVGGDFTSYNGLTENRIIRLNANGTKDTTFNTGVGVNDRVYKIAQQTNDKILVGGNFYTYKDNNSSSFLISLHNNDNLSNTTFTSPSDFTLWPNPVKDVLYIDSVDTTTILSVTVYNLQGKLLNENPFNNFKAINVSNLPAGFYLVKIKTVNGEFTRKFIKE